MESPTPKGATLYAALDAQASLLQEGIKLAAYIGREMKTVLNLHLILSAPLTRTNIQAIFRCIELLKAIEQTYHRRSMFVANATHHITQHLTLKGITILDGVRKRLEGEKR